jgi:hypothetical protein
LRKHNFLSPDLGRTWDYPLEGQGRRRPKIWDFGSETQVLVGGCFGAKSMPVTQIGLLRLQKPAWGEKIAI